ncbi:putative uncharacterized protein (plasmid) [Aliivibrio wodanis]|uniref:Uncharacterized protein n=1 Tax=Aliivibrio wodanis TaxID=80852 RepID=A0A090I8S0_9GAMM|nr:putative uncharacterized protein [Aliivibrio wodanis]
MVDKRARNVKLNLDVDAKLVKLCEILGVTINAYMLDALGKAINRDYLQFQVAESQQQGMQGLFDLLGQQLGDIASDANEEKIIND